MTAFAAATAVRPREAESTYDVDLDAGWSIGGKPNGGYLLAILARCALLAVDRPHALAVSGHFLRPPDGGPAEVRVEIVKTGRTVSSARATLWQGGKPRLDALVTAGTLGDGPEEWVAAPAPSMPPTEQCLAGEPPGFRVELLDHVDLRLDPATAPHGDGLTTATPLVRSWVRFRDGADADPLALALVVDALPPTVFNLGRFGWAPTVELTVLLRGIPAPGWLRCEARTAAVALGWFDEEASVWDSTGRLVAQSRQLALVGAG